MKWGPQAKLIDEALLKVYFVNISLLPRYIFIQHSKSSQNTFYNINSLFFKTKCLFFNKILIFIFMAEDKILYNTILRIQNNLHIYSNGLSP